MKFSGGGNETRDGVCFSFSRLMPFILRHSGGNICIVKKIQMFGGTTNRTQLEMRDLIEFRKLSLLTVNVGFLQADTTKRTLMTLLTFRLNCLSS